MVIVKMNNSTVECSIAAGELREIGLTPEAVVNGEKKSALFLAQIDQAVGEQLGYDPETEVLMITRNMMGDGSVRIFGMKLNDEDIQHATDRLRHAAEGILSLTEQPSIDAIKSLSGKEKGVALNKLLSDISHMMMEAYQSDEPEEEPQIEALAQPIVQVERYLAGLHSLEECARFARVIRHLPIKASRVYKERGEYYMVVEVMANGDGVAYEMRRLGLEYTHLLQLGSPELDHIEETGELLIRDHAVERLIEMGL